MVERGKWAKFPADPHRLTDAKTPYTTITLHHIGHELTPQAVEMVHRNREAPLDSMARHVAHAFGAAQTYDTYGDVGYNFLIGQDGTIYEGRALKSEGAHVRGHNPGNIGIAFLGDYGDKPFNDAQIRSSAALVGQLSHIFKIGPDRVFTHAQWDKDRPTELREPSRLGQIAAIRNVARKR